LTGGPLVAGNMPERFFAPYVDATLYPKFNLVGTAQSQGTYYYTLAFVVAPGDILTQNPLDLEPSTVSAWGGQATMRVNTEYMKEDIAGLRAIGGEVMISLGGANGTPLARLYSNPYASGTPEYAQREAENVDHLKRAYQFVVDTYDLSCLDFDIEGGAVRDPYSIQLRSKAIKTLQDDMAVAGRELHVWYTLPTLPSGLDGNGVSVLNKALDAGVDLAGVNVMAMDYGGVAPIIDPDTGQTVTKPNFPTKENDNPDIGHDSDDKGIMGDYGIQAAKNLFNQIKSAYNGHGISLSDAEVWRKVGITPMIGVNDVQEEVVDLSEAAEIYQFALSKDIGMLAFWSITRDHPADEGTFGQVSPKHSGLPEPPSYGFSRLMIPFSGDGSEAIYVSDASLEEGDSGTKTVTLSLWRLPASAESREISWATLDGAALAGEDYQAASGTVTFGPDETEKTVTVTISGDLDIEDDETFTVRYSTTSGVAIPDPDATVTILDDDTPPSAAIDDKTVGEAAGTATFTVSLSRASKAGQTATIDYEVVSGTATAGSDFTASTGTLSFGGAETTKTIAVPIIDDTVEETDEVFVVRLSNPVHVSLADKQGLGTIQDNDETPDGGYLWEVPDNWGSGWRGLFTFTNPGPDNWDPWRLEWDATWELSADTVWGRGIVELTERTGPDANGVYHYVFDPAAGNGLVAPGGQVQFDFTVNESDHSAPTNVTVNGTPLNQINQGPGVSIGDATTNEGDGGSHTVNLTVSLTEASGSEIQVAYAVVAGTATEGEDYTAAANGTLVFAPGDKSKTIPITVIGDTANEGDESVLVFIAGVDGQALPRITDNQGTLTIVGDDWTPSVTTTAAILKERDSGTRTATVKVRLNRAPKEGETIRVSYRTADGTAAAGEDYAAKSGTLTFAAGQTEKSVSLTINGDTDDETLELFRLEFHDPVGCLLGDELATIQIIDDDTTGSLGNQRIVAYVYGGALPGAFEVTHINYAFSNLNADGSWAFSGNLGGMRALRDRNPNLKLLVSIGGWGWSEHFSGVAADATKRARFAQSAVDLIKREHLNGVDIDWEWPAADGDYDTPGHPEDKHNFTLLMQETRDALDALEAETGRHYLLSAFTGAGSAQMAGLEMATLGQLFDYVNVQGYDLHGAWDEYTGHASGLHRNPADPMDANLNIESVLKIYEDGGIPKDKLLVGVAFYGRRMWAQSSENHGLFQRHGWSGDTPLYKDIVSGGQTGGFRYFWDGIAKAPWLFQDSNKVFVTFDDPRSAYEKAKFSRENGYGGTYFWQMGGDTSDHQLTTALHDTAAVRPNADSDADGMDDAWERDHFGDLDTAGPGTDFDQDGRSDLAEFIAGTHPKNGADFLRVTSLERTASAHALRWNAVAGKSYDVEYSPDLSPDSWTVVATSLSGGSFDDTDPGRLGRNNGFYRIRVVE